MTNSSLLQEKRKTGKKNREDGGREWKEGRGRVLLLGRKETREGKMGEKEQEREFISLLPFFLHLKNSAVGIVAEKDAAMGGFFMLLWFLLSGTRTKKAIYAFLVLLLPLPQFSLIIKIDSPPDFFCKRRGKENG